MKNWGPLTLSFFTASSFQPVRSLIVLVDGSHKLRDCLPPNARTRRSLLHQGALLIGTALGTPVVSYAKEEEESPPGDRGGKPFAPLEALLPVTRLKLWIDQAHALSSTLKRTNDKQAQYDILKQLDKMLSNPPKLFVSTSLKERTRSSTAQITTGVSSVNREEYRRNRARLSVTDRLAAMLNQADVERQWGMLQYQESKLEKDNEMRAAFNYYTSQLEYGDSYVLTASKEDKKRMIRDETLPSLTAVITSDLDVRELYRNQFLTDIEDVKAEISYQLKQPVESIDATDTLDLMNHVYTACAEWFNLIAPQDLQDAVNVVKNEHSGSDVKQYGFGVGD